MTFIISSDDQKKKWLHTIFECQIVRYFCLLANEISCNKILSCMWFPYFQGFFLTNWSGTDKLYLNFNLQIQWTKNFIFEEKFLRWLARRMNTRELRIVDYIHNIKKSSYRISRKKCTKKPSLLGQKYSVVQPIGCCNNSNGLE